MPASALLQLDFWPRLLAATTVAFLPIFLANLVFAGRFRDVGDSTGAFGANLLGAMVGGLVEYVALVTGYQALLLVVAVLYGIAWALGSRIGGAPQSGSSAGGGLAAPTRRKLIS